MAKQWTEADVLAALASKHSEEKGWAFLTHVRSATGASGMVRTADAIAMQTWPSRGLHLHGFEVKVSKRDLTKELQSPEKAEVIARYCHQWWMVTPKGLCDVGDLPDTWGLYEVDGRGVSQAKAAMHNPEPRPVGYTFLASLLRSVARDTRSFGSLLETVRREAHREGREVGREQEQRNRGDTRLREAHDALQERVRRFEEASGVTLTDGFHYGFGVDPEDLGKAFLVAIEDQKALRRLAEHRDRVLSSIERLHEHAQKEAS